MSKKRKNKNRKKSSKTKKPTLSLCMIVKDEEKYLGRCLESVKDIVDEIIIADTGSRDRSIEIAKKYGAKVIHHRWNDDFAAARNESLKHAAGEWILMLDADEEMDEVNKKKLMQIVRANKGIAYFLNLRSPVADNAAGVAFVNVHPRLFKNHLGICFEGRIHEQIFPSVKKLGGSIQMTDVVVHHHGYSKEKENKKEKLERNLRLLQKQVEEDPDFALGYFHLGETFALLKRTEEAITAYEQAIELGNIPTYLLAIAHQNLASALIKKREFAKVIEECNKALELQPSLLTPHFLMAYAAYSHGYYDKAILECRTYLGKAYQNEKRPDRYFEHEPNYGYVYTLLGHCYSRTCNFPKAEESYRQALTRANKYAETYLGLVQILVQSGRIDEAISLLEEALQIDEPKPQLSVALAKLYFIMGNNLIKQNKPTEAEQYFQKARALSPQTPEIHYNLAVIKIKRKDYQSAITHFLDLLKIEPTNVDVKRKLSALYSKLKNAKAVEVQ